MVSSPTPSPDDLAALRAGALPRHVAIIMDGNGRWAAGQGLPRVQGHREGARSVRDVVRAARRLGLEALTLFAFSEQNWDRPPDEVEALMELLYRYVLDERSEILDNEIRLTAIGVMERLPLAVRRALDTLVRESADRHGMILCLALSYGAREDVVVSARTLARQVLAGELDVEAIDEERFASQLSTAVLPPVDLLIRTSGEMRLSNFLLWELAYAELLFVPTMWPEFRQEHLYRAISEYQRRERRFGRTSAQVH